MTNLLAEVIGGKCSSCGALSLRSGDVPHAVHVGSREFFGKVPAAICTHCAENYVTGLSLMAFDFMVAEKIVRAGLRTGASFRFLRKTIGMNAVELARVLGVRAESISRWESGRRAVDRGAFLALELLVLDEISGTGGARPSTRSLLEAIESPHALAKRVRVA